MDKSYSFLLYNEFNDFQCYPNDEESYFNFFDEINHINGDKKTEINCMEILESLNQKKEITIDNNKPFDDIKSKITLLGRKKKDSSKKERYGKYSSDNIIKRIKSYLLTCLFNFINVVINNRYEGNIGHDIFQKQLLKINKQKILSSRDNKHLLNKTLKEIFSEVISPKYSNFYSKNHNKDLINQLLNEEDEEKRDFFNKLFNLTFIECLKHFRGSEIIEELKGLDSLDNILNKFQDDKDYIDNFKYYIIHFEEIIGRKRKKIIQKI